jgi:hypothetical protein
MARWAFGMLFLTLASVLVTAAGVVYVAKTLEANIESTGAAIEGVEIARKALTGLNRPYVIPIILEHNLPWGLTHREILSPDRNYYATIAFKNFGASPAIIRSVATFAGVNPIQGEPASPNPQFSAREPQIVAEAWILEGGQSTKTFRVQFGIPPEIRAILQAAPGIAKIIAEHENAGGYIIPSIHDAVTYSDLMGNIVTTRIRYDFTPSGFALNVLAEEGNRAN